MLVFVIPLKSAKVSASWDLVTKLFERCINSVCNQTCDEFRVVVVCHEKPNVNFFHPNITYIEVDYLLPKQQLKELNLEAKIDWREIEVFSKDIDKGRKLLTGLAYAENFLPSHVMVVDADDVISNNIAKFVKQNANCNGWCLKSGYIYHENRQVLERVFNNFYVACGSSIIIKYQSCNLLFKDYDYQHYKVRLINEIKLKPLPFPGAIYSVGNGENIYQTAERQNQRIKNSGIILKIKNVFKYRRLTKPIIDEFNFIPVIHENALN